VPDPTGLAWRKSSYSGGAGNCVEAAARWRTSSYSGSGGNCVEVAATRLDAVLVRDSLHPRHHLTFAPDHWRAFVRALDQLTR
jgi:hypothetical protein